MGSPRTRQFQITTSESEMASLFSGTPAILYRNAPPLLLLRPAGCPARPRRARSGPISRASRRAIAEASRRRAGAVWPDREGRGEYPYRLLRSEERRVGKEGRS